MSDPNALLLKANLRHLKLPTMLAEHDQCPPETITFAQGQVTTPQHTRSFHRTFAALVHTFLA